MYIKKQFRPTRTRAHLNDYICTLICTVDVFPPITANIDLILSERLTLPNYLLQIAEER